MFDRKAWMKQYRSDNKEKIKEQTKAYRLKHKETYDLYQKEYSKKYREEHKEEAKAYKKQWQQDNKEYCKQKKKIRYQNNKDHILQKVTEWSEKNPDKVYESKRRWAKRNPNYTITKIHTDLQYKLKHYLRNRLFKALKTNAKTGSTIHNLGCSIADLIIHLEKQFQDGMTWENHGKWHIDHIIPLCSFDLTDLEQVKKACHYTNLQPLWAIDNLRKNGKIIKK